MKYIFVGLGELILDRTYDERLRTLTENGGYSTFNVLYDLGFLGEKEVYAVGVGGNDVNGIKARRLFGEIC